MSSLNEQTIDYLKNLISKKSKLPVEQIDANASFETYGVDSILISELSDAIESDLGEIPKTLFFEYENLRELALYFIESKSPELSQLLGKKGEVLSMNVPKVDKVIESPITENKQESISISQNKDFAIVGLSGQFPQANTLREFWENLKAGKDSIELVPKERWDYEAIFNTDRTVPGTSYLKWGGFIKDYDKFDPLFFNISKLEAETLDPQERLFLQTVYHTLEDAGYTKSALQNERVGVYAGIMWGQYQLYGAAKANAGSSYASVANRVSYFFDFKGPSIALDTMCSSSLTAIHLACQDLLLGECSVAIAGGVNINSHPNKHIFLSKTGFAATDGKCHSFGEGGDGYVPGDGVGAVMIKRLEDAIKDNDYIYGVIKSTAINHGGKSNGYTVPTPKAHSALIGAAIEKAGINPENIGYIEAHGTGTSLGDPIEIRGLDNVFKEYTNRKQFCPIGSVKSNVGHLESAAGVAGLAKVLLQMKHKQLVPSIHSEPQNKNINFNDTAFYVQKELSDWKVNRNSDNTINKRIGAVSSFGAGGANAHIIVEEYTNVFELADADNFIIPVSAKSKEQLRAYCEDIYNYLMNDLPEFDLSESHSNSSQNKLDHYINSLIQIISKVLNINPAFIEAEETLNHLDATEGELREINLNIQAAFDQPSIRPLDGRVSIESIASEIYQSIEKQAAPITEAKTLLRDKYLGSISYTLQIGREAMKHRVAFVVKSIDDLQEALKNYLEGKLDSTSMVAGRGENSEQVVDTDINQLLEKKRVRKLAELWANGTTIDWYKLYEASKKPKKLPLPNYPFKKERCWVVDEALPQSTLLPKTFSFPEKFFINQSWRSLDLKTLRARAQDKKILIISTPEASLLRSTLKEILGDQVKGCILIGEKTRLIGDAEWEMTVADVEAGMSAVIESIGPVDRIVCCPHMSSDFKNQNSDTWLAASDAMIFYSKCLQYFSKISDAKMPVEFDFLTMGSLNVTELEIPYVYGSLFLGLAQTAAKEYRNIQFTLVDLQLNNTDNIIDVMQGLKKQLYIMEMYDLDYADQGIVSLRDNVLYVQDYQSVILEEYNDKLRKGGRYVIFGAAGVVGKKLTEYLSEKYQAKLVLVGRSEMNDDLKSWVGSLPGNENIQYQSLDMNDSKAVNKLFERMSQENEPINGIFHLAMQYDYKKIPDYTVDNLRGFLSAKTRGTINIALAAREYFPSMDFLTLFSSVEAYVGNPGWSAYSAACLCQDQIGAWLNKTILRNKVKVINWGFWSGSERGDEHLLVQKGINPISKELGMQALKVILSSSTEHVFALDVSDAVLEKMRLLSTNASKKPISPNEPEISNDVKVEEASPKQESRKLSENDVLKLQQYLIRVISETLKIDASNIEPAADLAEYGVDSLIVVNIHKAFEQDFGQLPGTLLIENMSVATVAEFLSAEKSLDVMRVLSLEQDAVVDVAIKIDTPKIKQVEEGVELIHRLSQDVIVDYLSEYGKKYREKSLVNGSNQSTTLSQLHAQDLNHLLMKLKSGKTVEVFVIGQGKPLFFIPAVALTAPVWINQLQTLASQYKLIIVHAPSYGLSDKISELNTAGVSKVYMEALDMICPNEKINIISSCFGGISAQYLGAHYPERIGKLVFCGGFFDNIGLPDVDPNKLSIDEIFEMIKTVSSSLKADFETVINNLPAHQSQEKSNCAWACELLLNSQCADPLVAMKYLNELVGFSAEPWLHKIQSETLCITGTLDTVVNPSASLRMTEIIKDSSLKIIEGAGHYPFLTHSQEFDQMITTFIN